MNNKMRKAIILVAGMGTRLRPLTDNNHKCLTEVNGVSILNNCLNCLNEKGFSEAVLVVGYLGGKIIDLIGNRYKNMKISYAENINYETTNTSASLLIGLHKIHSYEEIYVIEGDVFYDISVLTRLIENNKENATILEPYNSDLSGTFVGLDSKSYIYEWKHKSVQDRYYKVEDKYKTVNIHKFSRKFINTILEPMLKESVNDANGTEPLEYVMDRVVSSGRSMIYGEVLKGQKWFEIDDQDDLRKAESLFF